ncbi:MAG: protein-S-isoprenylcysteine O-methyltransferase [Rhodopseudomonas sp.]|uniref:protein-S-isoprenylcysteine O-methyltransferase n=1 Tax=Rhodopseudomonas sp. TaxID=1078 RepID=UPI0039E47753
MIKTLPAIVAALAGVVLIGLALWRWHDHGWGSLIWLIALIAMFVVRTPHSLRNRANVVTQARKDATEITLLAGMFLTTMVLPLLYLATDMFDFADYAAPDWTVWIGTLAQIPFLWLFWRSHADLGRNWSPGLEVREAHELVTDGVYDRIRHPMYAAIWISALAQPLLIHNWIGGFLVVPAFAAMWFIRVPHEEAMMRARFGEAWNAYCARSGRLWPKRYYDGAPS